MYCSVDAVLHFVRSMVNVALLMLPLLSHWSRRRYARAASQAHVAAQRGLAECFRFGLGTERDERRAFDLCAQYTEPL